jgi:hypothetical protein
VLVHGSATPSLDGTYNHGFSSVTSVGGANCLFPGAGVNPSTDPLYVADARTPGQAIDVVSWVPPDDSSQCSGTGYYVQTWNPSGSSTNQQTDFVAIVP